MYMRNPLLFYSQRGILYYSTPREESFTIQSFTILLLLLPERNPFYIHTYMFRAAGGPLRGLRPAGPPVADLEAININQ